MEKKISELERNTRVAGLQLPPMKIFLPAFCLAALSAAAHAQDQSRAGIRSASPQSLESSGQAIYSTVDAYGNRSTTFVVPNPSVAQAGRQQDGWNRNQWSNDPKWGDDSGWDTSYRPRSNFRRQQTPRFVPVPVPVGGIGFYPYPVPVPAPIIQQVPLGRSVFGWDRPPTITSIPLGTFSTTPWPAPVYPQQYYGQPVYGQPFYGQPLYGASGYCPPNLGYNQSGASFSVAGSGLSFSFSASGQH